MKNYLTKVSFDECERVKQTLEAERSVWNFCAEKCWKAKTLSLPELHTKVYKKFRKKFPEVPSQIVIRGENAFLASFRSARSNKRPFKKLPQKTKLSLQLDKRIFSLSGNQISVTAIGGKRVKGKILMYPRLMEAMKNGICDPKIIFRNNEFWLCIPCQTANPTLTAPQVCIGVDIGIKRAVVTSEGMMISRKNLNRQIRKFSFNKRKLQAKKTRSAKRKLKKLSHRHRNMSKDFTHICVNKVLDTKADTISIEWLKSLKGKSRGTYMNRLLGQWACGAFRTILEYKAQILGKRIVTVKPAFTSQNDWRGIPNGTRKGRRYVASDGKVFDSDWNAAMNIGKLSNIPVSYREVLDGQARVTEPNSSLRIGNDFKIGNVEPHVLQAPEFIRG